MHSASIALLALLGSSLTHGQSAQPSRKALDIASLEDGVIKQWKELWSSPLRSFDAERRFVDISFRDLPLDAPPTLSLARTINGAADIALARAALSELQAFANDTGGASIPGVKEYIGHYHVFLSGSEVLQQMVHRDNSVERVDIEAPPILLDYEPSNKQLGLYDSGTFVTLGIPFILRPIGLYATTLDDYYSWTWRIESSDQSGVRVRLEPAIVNGEAARPSLILLVDPETKVVTCAIAYNGTGRMEAAAAFAYSQVDGRLVPLESTFVFGDERAASLMTISLSNFVSARPGEPVKLPPIDVCAGTGAFDFRNGATDFLGRVAAKWPREVQERTSAETPTYARPLEARVDGGEATAASTKVATSTILTAWPPILACAGAFLLVCLGLLGRWKAQQREEVENV